MPKLNIRKLPNQQAELIWPSQTGYKYHVQKSSNLVTWTDYAGPYDGEDDQTEFHLPIPAADTKSFFRLIISAPYGTDAKPYAITALDGSHVMLHWNFGPAVSNERYEILRDDYPLAYVAGNVAEYRDGTVQSGKTYKYDVRIVA